MANRWAIALLILLGLAWAPLDAAAQTDPSQVAIGGNVSLKGSIEGDSSGHTTLGFLWRLGNGRKGWGPTYGLNWYSAHLDTNLDGQRLAFGELKVRPFTIGYGYSTTIRRIQASANIVAGLALTSFSLSDEADGAFRRQLTAGALHTVVSNPLVVRPGISVWVNVSRKVGVNVSTGYTIAHPRVRIESPNGDIERRVDASMFTLAVGAAYSIF